MKKYLHIAVLALSLTCAVPVQGAVNYSKMNVSKLEKLADKNDAYAQYLLGLSYAKGERGAAQDFTKAAYWYAKAAEAGRGGAQFELAVCYMNGEGVQYNPTEAIRLLELCVDNPSADSEIQFLSRLNLANYYGHGKYGLDVNLDKAISLLEGAKLQYFTTNQSEMNLYGSQHDMLGEMYFNKAMQTLEASDFKKSAENYVEAAADWDKYSSYSTDYKKNRERMGNSWLAAGNSLFMANTFNGDEDYSKVMNYWEKAATQFNKQAMYNLGELYYTGIGNLPADEPKGISYLERVSGSNPRAAYFLGLHYYAKDIDFGKAFKYFTQAYNNPALDNDDVRADLMQKFATMYRFGRGVEADEAKADAFTAGAAKLGNPDAIKIQQWLSQK